MKTTTIFTPEDIEKLIKAKLKITKCESIAPILEEECHGHFMSERYVQVFKGYRVVL